MDMNIQCKPEKIIVFVDRRWINNNIFYKLNFKLNEMLGPTFWYTFGQYRYNKKSIKNSIIQKNYNKIWDCGYLKLIKEY